MPELGRELLPEINFFHLRDLPAKHSLLIMHFILSPFHNLILTPGPPPRNPEPLALSLAQDGINLNHLAAIWVSYLCVAPVHMYLIKIVLFFLPVNLFYANLILRPAQEPRKIDGKFFPALKKYDFFFLNRKKSK